MSAINNPVGHGHASPPAAFLQSLIAWARSEDDSVFAPNPHLGDKDVFNIIAPKLGHATDILTRKAQLCEVLRCLAGDESDWDWREGRDTTAGAETPDQMEAGAFQVSYDSRLLGTDLEDFLASKGIANAAKFQEAIKTYPTLDMAYAARLLRDATRWDGPTNRGWILDQVQPAAVAEFAALLQPEAPVDT